MTLNKNLNLDDDEANALLSLLQFFVSSEKEMEKIYIYYKSQKKDIASLYEKFTGKTVDGYLRALDLYDEEK